MPDTSLSLLARLHQTTDAAAWERLTHLYSPLIRRWLARAPLQPSDADDLLQDVLTAVVRKVPEFRHDGRPGAFRCWLRVIAVNRLRDHWRARSARGAESGDSGLARMLDELEDPHSGLSRVWDREHDWHVLHRLLDLIEPEFKPSTWQAFRRHVIGGESVDDVARALDLSANAVFIAKSRVLSRLREEGRGLIDDPPAFPDPA
jgi:RNA polymerase sigma-70 factor (ECF subfamily)